MHGDTPTRKALVTFTGLENFMKIEKKTSS